MPGRAGYSIRFVPRQMVCPFSIHCISLRQIVRVESEVVERKHLWYRPSCQRMHVLRFIDHIGNRSLGAVIIRLGGGCNPTTGNISPHSGTTYPGIEQWDAIRSEYRYIHSFINHILLRNILIKRFFASLMADSDVL